ncbi:histidinol phosphate phosphatase domain-containing protein [Elusimicrobiota bacterium]
MKIVDLHMHTFFSDGILSPAELVYRCKLKGCQAIAITDHADYSNYEFVISSISRAASKLRDFYEIEVITGVELTYIPPDDIQEMVSNSRQKGAELVIVHGETTAEQVPPGTNMAAVVSKCDILAHPGRLSDEEAKTAAVNDVCIEITTRRGHRMTNKEVFMKAKKYGCPVLLNTDSHDPDDLLDEDKITGVLDQCGLDNKYYDEFLKTSCNLIEKIRSNRT